ncbi:MAG: choice-of-anchor I family protein [Bacteroidota bacterium]
MKNKTMKHVQRSFTAPAFVFAFISAVCALINTVNAQTIIYTTNFGSVANVNPTGWTFTGIDMNISTNTSSSGYTGASGGAYLGEGNSTAFINTAGTAQPSSQTGTSEAILLVNTTGHTSVTVSFGMRKSSAGYNTNATYAFEWSTDGVAYNTIPYTESSTGNWGLVSGAGLTLPAGAGNQPTLYLRWSFVRTGTASNYKIDDVTVSSATPLPPSNIGFSSDNQTILESIGTVTANISITSSNANPSSVEVVVIPFGTAAVGSDLAYTTQTVTFPGNATGTLPITITINDDLFPEASEYFAIKLQNPVNAVLTNTLQQTIFIKDNDNSTPIGSNEVSMTFVSSFTNGAFATNSAEIVAHDPISQRLFVANSIGKKLDIIDFSNPNSMSIISSIDISMYGNINSVAVQNGIVACAIENTMPELDGFVVLFNTNGVFQKQVTVGALPDMITFNHAGTRILTANEGQPNATYSIDPEGSVSIIDISGGIASLSQSNVTTALFTAFNGQMASLKASGVRIYGPGSTVAQDMEPEYITVSEDDLTAYVVLQENNAFGYVDLTTNTITDIKPLGFKDHSALGNGLDATNTGSNVNIANWPIKGMYLPDAISHFNVGGIEYLITANEGDARADYGAANNEETSIGALTYSLDPTAFPHASVMKNNANLGKLKCTNRLGDTDNDGDFDEIYTFGARSFSIWNATTGTLVYDSGDDLEEITANDPVYGAMFNCSNTNITKKDRSDDKGPEPEGVAVATIAGNLYAFVSMERVGGLMVFNINNPVAPQFVQYINNRGLTGLTGDRGPEGIIYVTQQNSPTGKALVVLGNEVSSSVSVYEIACPSVSATAVSASSVACVGNTLAINSSTISGATYSWYNGATLIAGATTAIYNATVSGNYSVKLDGVGCTIPSNSVSLTFNALPTLTVTTSATTTCSGETVTLTSTGAQTYTWTSGPISNTYSVSPTANATYTVLGIDLNGCSNLSVFTVSVNPTPALTAAANNTIICSGDVVDLTTSGALTYTWSTGSNSTSYSVSPTSDITYFVTGTDANGCLGNAAVTITVNALPTLTTTASSTAICSGNTTSLTVSGASSYTWIAGPNTSTYIVSPGSNTTYTVQATDLNNCTNTGVIAISVNMTPTITASATNATICAGESVTLTANGASTYTWLPSNATSTTEIVSPGVNTTYSLTGSDNGCNATSNIMIQVNQLPTVSANTSNTLMCVGENVVLTANSSATSYTWSTGALTMSTTVSPTTTTVYTLTVNDGLCSASSSITQNVSLCTSLVQMNRGDSNLSIYPNPFNSFFEVKWNMNFSKSDNTTVMVYNTLGEIIYSDETSESSVSINSKNWVNGTYYIKVNNTVSKIIKQE